MLRPGTSVKRSGESTVCLTPDRLPDPGGNVVLSLMWAKTGSTVDGLEGECTLVHHLLDAAGAAGELWNWIPPASRRHVETDLRRYGIEDPVASAADLIRLAAGIHDIGKASPVFQANAAVRFDKLVALDSRFKAMKAKPMLPPKDDYAKYRETYGQTSHGIAGDYAMQRKYPQLVNFSGDSRCATATNNAVEVLSAIVGGHHGYFTRSHDQLNRAGNFASRAVSLEHTHPNNVGSVDCLSCWWQAVRAAHIRCVEDVVGVKVDSFRDVILSPSSRVIIAAMVVLADWTVSNTSNVELSPYGEGVESRPLTLSAGEQAVGKLNLPALWTPTRFTDIHSSLRSRFAAFRGEGAYSPTPLQKKSFDTASSSSFVDNEGGFMLIEAPAGCGKTEAALAAAEMMSARNGMSGAALLLPTRLTTNMMFRRFSRWVSEAAGTEQTVLALSHGSARLNIEAKTRPSDGFGFRKYTKSVQIDQCCDDRDSAEVGTHDWLSSSGRVLLSPFVVGTVDNILSAVKIGKHISLQHLGLAGKVVIIDEVHDSDPHMRELLSVFLAWAAEYRIPVVALTATASPSLRRELHEAYSGEPCKLSDDELRAFPVVTTSRRGSSTKVNRVPLPRGYRLPGSGSVRMKVDFSLTSPETIANAAAKAYHSGACTAVVCNTVARAQEVYRLVQSLGVKTFSLHHSQFFDGDRSQRDDDLMARLGPDDSRRAPCVVVATQVIQQSLDIDFDYMISDAAPLDVLIQRAGRVHRHMRSTRPKGFTRAVVDVAGVESSDCTRFTGEKLSVEESGKSYGIGTNKVYPKRKLMDTAIWLSSTTVSGSKTVNIVRATTEVMGILDGFPDRDTRCKTSTRKASTETLLPHISRCAPHVQQTWMDALRDEVSAEMETRDKARTGSAIDTPSEMRSAFMHDFPKKSINANLQDIRDVSRRASTRSGSQDPRVLIVVRSSDGGYGVPLWVAQRNRMAEGGSIPFDNTNAKDRYIYLWSLATCSFSPRMYGVMSAKWLRSVRESEKDEYLFDRNVLYVNELTDKTYGLIGCRDFVVVMDTSNDGDAVETHIGGEHIRYSFDTGLVLNGDRSVERSDAVVDLRVI